MIDDTKVISGFLVVDPVANMQEYISNIDLDAMREAVAMGCTLVAEYRDGTRTRVDPEEIVAYFAERKTEIHVVRQEEFVPIMHALMDLMEESMAPAVALLSVSGQQKNVNSKFAALKQEVDAMLEKYEPNLEQEGDE